MFWSTAVCRPVRDIEVLRDLQVCVIDIIIAITIPTIIIIVIIFAITITIITMAMSDTHVFLLNEYFVELNTANFNILNKFLN